MEKTTGMTVRRLLLVLAVLVMAALFAVFFAVYRGLPAGATATPPPGHWLISQPELARIRAAGATAQFQWVMCDPRRPSDTSCPVPTFTSYYEFRAWAPAHPGATAEIDYENSVTPRWQMTHLLRYIQLAGQAGHAFGVFTIFSPVTSPSTVPTSMLTADVQAARYGDAVDIQLQWMEHHPSSYAGLLRSWVPQIRAAGHALVLAGLATDPEGRPVTPWTLTRTYELTRGLVDGYWLNVHPWPGKPGCAPQGCPQVAVAFLARI